MDATDIPEELYARLLSVSQEAAVSMLLAAIKNMQGYNGQSVTEAITGAIGADSTEGDARQDH